MIFDKYLHTSRRVKGEVIYAMVTTLAFYTFSEIYLHCTGETTSRRLTDCPDKMKLAFGSATVKTMDP